MKTKRIINFRQSPDCARQVDTVVNTVDGLERAHINLATGEITYGPDACINEALLEEAFAREGLELEENTD